MGLRHIYFRHSICNLVGNLFRTFSLIIFISFCFGQGGMPENNLANELGCGNCHGGASASSIIKNRAPDLSYAGLKYNEAFLFDYLKSPKSIRKNIGKSRMPDFEFSDDEALALTKYLMTRKNLPHGRTLSQSRIRNNDNGFNLIHNELQRSEELV